MTTTTRTCSLFALLLAFCLFRLPAATTASSSSGGSSWVLAAQKFTFAGSRLPAGADQIESLLPQLILEQISTGSTRTLPADEVLSRKLDNLQTARLSLFLQLSKEYKTRDALVANVLSPRKLEKQLAAEQKKIKEIEEQIDENLAEVEKETQAAAPAIRREQALQKGEVLEDEQHSDRRFPFPFQLPFPFFRQETDDSVAEFVTLYKNDISQLFKPTDATLLEGLDSRTFEKEIAAAKINGLLSGSITAFGDYISVTLTLWLYPGAKTAATVTEIGLSSDLLSLAERLVRALTPRLTNTLPVVMHISVLPEEAAAGAMLTLDGIVFPRVPSELSVDAAIHTISVSAPGYETASISYQFTGREVYEMKVSLLPEVKGVLSLRLKRFKDGIFYASGVDSAQVTVEEPRGQISINGKSVLGVFTTGTGEESASAFFYISPRLAREDSHLVVNAKPYDRAANIDKRRRRMYTAYSALICSLPLTFYCMGNFTAANNGYSMGRATYDDAVLWQNRTNIAVGVTAVCGIWTLWELFRYLRAANEALPAAAYRDKQE